MHTCMHTCAYIPSSYTSYFHYSVYMHYTLYSIGITVSVHYSIVITSYCLLQMMCSVSTLDLHVCQPGQETNHDVSTQKVSTQEVTPGGVSIPCPGMGWTHLLRWMPLLAWGVYPRRYVHPRMHMVDDWCVYPRKHVTQYYNTSEDELQPIPSHVPSHTIVFEKVFT